MVVTAMGTSVELGQGFSACSVSALPQIADIDWLLRNVRFVPIVLKKSFFADDRKFSEVLLRLTRFDVRDLINPRKSGRWRSYRSYRALAVAEIANIGH